MFGQIDVLQRHCPRNTLTTSITASDFDGDGINDDDDPDIDNDGTPNVAR
jgi:hypothetical protein